MPAAGASTRRTPGAFPSRGGCGRTGEWVMTAETDHRSDSPGRAGAGGRRHGHGHGHAGPFTRMREATGTVYGDIGTSVLYTVMEILRETIRLKHHAAGSGDLEAQLEAGG